MDACVRMHWPGGRGLVTQTVSQRGVRQKKNWRKRRKKWIYMKVFAFSRRNGENVVNGGGAGARKTTAWRWNFTYKKPYTPMIKIFRRRKSSLKIIITLKSFDNKCLERTTRSFSLRESFNFSVGCNSITSHFNPLPWNCYADIQIIKVSG